jgi:hypothetical protein
MSKKSKEPPWLQDAIDRSTGKGVLTAFGDRAFWLTPEEEDHWVWFHALEQVDSKGDLTALLARLEACVPPAMWPHVKDLFKRYTLKRVPGKPRTPSYEKGKRLLRDADLARTLDRVRTLKATGMKVGDAIFSLTLNFSPSLPGAGAWRTITNKQGV